MSQGRQGPEGPLAPTRAAVRAALAALEASRERIDNLNVYPVPDGDTGTNMTLTVRAVADALDASTASGPDEVARDVVRASLMGARGNSGVILSQLVRGAVEALVSARTLDASVLAVVLRGASDAGYASVREPQEGTILTVVRELAERAEAIAAPELSLGDAFAEVVAHGEESLARTPEHLEILRRAGVVDAGGAGLLEAVRGIAAWVRGELLPDRPGGDERLPLEAVHVEVSDFRYCTSFFVEGEDADPDRLEEELRTLGDSVLVVGSRGAVKAHLHTNEPGRVLSLATSIGVIEEVDIKNMHVQAADRTERILSAPAACDVVAVCAGEGNARLFRDLGAAAVVPGGQSMNPPAAELVEAIESVAAGEAILLPNNANVTLTARQAAELTTKPVRIVPTESMQAGLGAMVAYSPARSAEENSTDMEAAAALVRTGAVTRASRSTVIGGLAIEEGEFLGLVSGDPVVSGPALDAVAREVAERLLVEASDVLTVLVGADAGSIDGLREEIQAAHPELEVEFHDGGQPHYPLLFSAE